MKKAFVWILAFIITVVAVIYQRKTGPTYPKNYTVNIGEERYKVSLLRSHAGERDCLVEIMIDDKDVTGNLYYKRYKTNDSYKTVRLVQYRNELCAVLPHQPPAGKLQYYIELVKNEKKIPIAKDEPVVIRFRGDVPAYIVIPHVLLIFMAMFFSTLSGLYVVFKKEDYGKYVKWAFFTLLVGGFIFGPLMQKFAFGEFWTGIPFGFDLTDNKTLFAFLFWLWAFIANRKKERPTPVLVACIMTLVIFSIPHSMMGSELDYSTNKINTGMILFKML
jgi:hypothetical protein